MFENVLGQPAKEQLSRDIETASLAPSMLFSGPPASGKGTAGLELGRILSCENRDVLAPWNCSCSACVRHRLLIHPDILLLGSRPFSAETAAAAAAFLRDPDNTPGRLLYIRSVRKLLARFSPVLWEDDPKLGKFSSYLTALEEDLDDSENLGKNSPRILKNVFKLEAEGIGESIPVAHIRRAAYWSRLAPAGKRKLLLIENADRMAEGARNSLLKILEEPPDTVNIVLTSSRPEAMLPTILSRLRLCRFISRDKTVEAEVIRRVFRDGSYGENRNDPAGQDGRGITAYLDSFLPVSGETINALAAFFAASVAMKTILILKRRGTASPPGELVDLGRYAAPIAEASGLGRPQEDALEVSAKVLGRAENFEARSLFPRFLSRLLSLVSESSLPPRIPLATGEGDTCRNFPLIAYNDIWRKYVKEADTAVSAYNQSPCLALERLCTELSRAMAEAGGG